MYETYFHLSGKPFQLNPDPSFYFGSRGHKRAFAYLDASEMTNMPTNPAYAAGAIEHDPRSIGAVMTAATRRFEAWQIR